MQDIVYKPRAPIPGETVTISVVPDGKALEGVEVRLLWLAPKASDAPGSARAAAASNEDAKALGLGKTDRDGIVRWKPEKVGTAEIQVDHGDLRLAAHIEVYSQPSWLSWALPFALAAVAVLLITKSANRHAELREADEAERVRASAVESLDARARDADGG